jgi:Fe-S oxidoreductase
VKITDVIRALRCLEWLDNQPVSGLPSLLWSVYWNNNPWDQPPSHRSQWASGLSLPSFSPEEHEILYYVGCSAAYETRAQKIAMSMVKLLTAGQVVFGTLGDDEPCSGEEILSIGHLPYFREHAAKVYEKFIASGVRRMVTSDPHSYDAFQNHYPSGDGALQVDHYTQYLAELLDEGKLSFKPSENIRITYHDPCYLSRHNDETAAPRKILKAIPGVELVEMERHGSETICCGGGGGRMWLETDPSERFSDLRVSQAMDTGADILATACPYCVTCLEDSLKSKRITGMIVLDVAEIAANALVAFE